jgi:hypothetical protein
MLAPRTKLRRHCDQGENENSFWIINFSILPNGTCLKCNTCGGTSGCS